MSHQRIVQMQKSKEVQLLWNKSQSQEYSRLIFVEREASPQKSPFNRMCNCKLRVGGERQSELVLAHVQYWYRTHYLNIVGCGSLNTTKTILMNSQISH